MRWMKGRLRRWQKCLAWYDWERFYIYKDARTGWPPIRETAASIKSDWTSIGPSGTPSSTEVSTSDKSSWSESDQSSSWGGILREKSQKCALKSQKDKKRNQISMNGMKILRLVMFWRNRETLPLRFQTSSSMVHHEIQRKGRLLNGSERWKKVRRWNLERVLTAGQTQPNRNGHWSTTPRRLIMRRAVLPTPSPSIWTSISMPASGGPYAPRSEFPSNSLIARHPKRRGVALSCAECRR